MKRPKFKRVRISEKVVLKSGLEEEVFNKLNIHNCLFEYEGLTLSYFQPQVKKTYKPDFPMTGSFIVETKGNFNSADRKKMKLVKAQYPELDIRFVFSNSKTKIGKKSKTTYAKWCELNDFPYHCVYSTKQIFPTDWINEIKETQNARRN